MSTKFTIYDSKEIHMYGDVFDSENISLNMLNPLFVSLLITNDNNSNVNNQSATIKINKIIFKKICKEYISWIEKNEK